MKKILLTTILLFILFFVPSSIFAQGMMSNWTSSSSSVTADDHTAREEAEGKEIWEKLQAKEITCAELADENFGSLGEYFMGQMMGDAHEAMNNRLIQMLGEEGEEQMHIAMGKRMSGCDPNASLPQNMMGGGMMPMMMSMMGGGGNPMMDYGWNNMMGGFGLLGWIPMLLFWILLILGVVALFRYLGGSARSDDKGRSPLDILKERYAKGEIDKKEFNEMKKDLA